MVIRIKPSFRHINSYSCILIHIHLFSFIFIYKPCEIPWHFPGPEIQAHQSVYTFDAPISNWFESNHSICSILWQCNFLCIMLNHISVTPREKRPRVTSAVVTIADDNEVLLVELENTGSSILSAFVPVIGDQEQWTHYDPTSHPLRRKPPHIWKCLVHVYFVFVCVGVFVLHRFAVQGLSS